MSTDLPDRLSRELASTGAAAGPTRPWPARESRWYRLCDRATEILLYLLLVAAPWCFGATEEWSIWGMTALSWVLGGLLLGKKVLQRTPEAVGTKNKFLRSLPGCSVGHGAPISLLALMALTGLILLYGFISVVNARSAYYPDAFRFVERAHLTWLPHSFDRWQSLSGLVIYAGLALAFWAALDWLVDDPLPRPGSRAEMPGRSAVRDRHDAYSAAPDRPAPRFLTPKLTRLLWVLCINGALLGIESILQRLDGGGKLLWIRTTRIYPWAEFQFGPYAYRGNAAQYFNLIWPVCLGFCWSLRAEQRRKAGGQTKVGSGPHLLLMPMAILMAACPVISTSRGGALLATVGLLILFAAFFFLRRRHQTISTLGSIGLAILLLGPGFYLGWAPLKKRWLELTTENVDVSGGRLEQYEMAVKMIRDYPLFGMGPSTYPHMCQFYLDALQEWFWQAHNDWLQTIAEWGAIGFCLIVAALLLALAIPAKRGTSNPVLLCTLFVSLFLTLVHAVFDFPFQIHSILFTYLVLLAAAISLAFTSRPEAQAKPLGV